MLPLVSLHTPTTSTAWARALDDALTQVREKRFEDHRVGLHVEVPIGNQAAESRLRRAILSRTQRLATKDQRPAQIAQEVLIAVDQLEANWQRILAARQRVIARRPRGGCGDPPVQPGPADQHRRAGRPDPPGQRPASEITAITEYQIAQVDIAFATARCWARATSSGSRRP